MGVEYIEVVNNDEDGSAELNACVSQHLVVRARREPSANLGLIPFRMKRRTMAD